jgi:hypothetical protein
VVARDREREREREQGQVHRAVGHLDLPELQPRRLLRAAGRRPRGGVRGGARRGARPWCGPTCCRALSSARLASCAARSSASFSCARPPPPQPPQPRARG